MSDPDIFRLVDTNITRFLNNLINQQSQTQSGKHDYHTTSRTSSSATITTSYKVNRKASQSGTVCLSFYAKTYKRQWFSTKEEKVYWEQWVIPINIVNHSSLRSHERETRTQELKDVVRACLAYIVKMVNEKKDHIPPVISKAMVCFPFDLTSSAGGGEGDDTNWSLNNFARMLKQGPTFKI